MSTGPTLSVLLAISTSHSTVDHVGLMGVQVPLQVNWHNGGGGMEFYLGFVLCIRFMVLYHKASKILQCFLLPSFHDFGKTYGGGDHLMK